ncbi:glycoside hydrolase family 3 protein [Planobispora rosea]|uniref:glycoside hydrolase family 3 protein n=1 Tax=Planobispora rosea TaxID=35762 RepID=UPI00083B16CA|nr:glycoside hydrolase family 3 N-terminal domain-containing protein [Planobispora rosea]
MPHSSPDLARLAMTVLQPGFDGTAPPGWLRRALGEGLGGVVLFARNLVDPAQTAGLVAALRAESPAMVVAVDEEGGAVTRLEAGTGSSFPGNRALGVADDTGRTEGVARAIGRLLAAADITLDYAPVADVNANPANPVIGVRSFGPDPALAARHTAAWVRGLQGAGVAACAKHFPGHGDTVTDSHLALPTVHASLDVLRERDLPPFRAALAAGVRAVMCGHLLVPALDPDAPATLSRRILTGLLREELGFDGMLVTDAIEMRAVAALHPPGEVAVRALAAGADAICAGASSPGGESVHALRDAIVEAVHAGRLPEERLAEAASRVLALAAWHAGRADLRSAPGPGSEDGAEGVAIGLEAARAAVRIVVPGPAATAATARTTVATGIIGTTGTTGTAATAATAEADGAFRGAEPGIGGPPPPPLPTPPFVVDIAPRPNLAADPATPAGLLGALRETLPGTAGHTVTAREPELPALPDGRPVVLVVHDAGRHPWVREALARAVRLRPDAIVVETGIPDEPVGAVYVTTHGVSRASARVVARWLTGGK